MIYLNQFTSSLTIFRSFIIDSSYGVKLLPLPDLWFYFSSTRFEIDKQGAQHQSALIVAFNQHAIVEIVWTSLLRFGYPNSSFAHAIRMFTYHYQVDGIGFVGVGGESPCFTITIHFDLLSQK